MSFYADYLRERTSDEIIETEDGFATYRFIEAGTVYIIDIYIKPESRKTRAASNIADTIVEAAKLRGCNKLIGSVAPSTKGSTTSLKVLLGYGMSLESSGNDFIIFQKAI